LLIENFYFNLAGKWGYSLYQARPEEMHLCYVQFNEGIRKVLNEAETHVKWKQHLKKY
jgi:hypothetical protein